MKKYLIYLFTVMLMSCSDYLDVVPENLATIDMAFSNRASSIKYLYTLYDAMPSHVDVNNNPAMVGGDEIWLYPKEIGLGSFFGGTATFDYALGLQNGTSPILNYWPQFYKGIRECNIFIDNIHKPIDLDDYERKIWIAEAKFIKAYLHYSLFKMYGPIPIVDKNKNIDSSPEEVRTKREKVSVVVDYIVKTLDEAIEDLPLELQDQNTELGRITKPIAACIKAKVLVLAASPVYNTSGLFDDFKDKEGNLLIDNTDSADKWIKAKVAVTEAIELSKNANHHLYYHADTRKMSDSTRYKMNLRATITEKWNPEIIWGESGRSTDHLQRICQPRLIGDHTKNHGIRNLYAPTLRMAEAFLTDKGLPISEDKTYDYENRMNLKTAGFDDRYYIQQGFETIGLHFNREPRFYASLAFDGGKMYGNGKYNDEDMHTTKFKAKHTAGVFSSEKFSITGYLAKKFVSHRNSLGNASNYNTERYAFPRIRLSDMYLLLAETLNESDAPVSEVFEPINEIRKKYNLPTVQNSYDNFAINPDKYKTKAGRRGIIKAERTSELAFEGHRFWDVRRWLDFEKVTKDPIRGLNIMADDNSFYKTVMIFQQELNRKDYFWPISESELLINTTLTQSPGW